MSWNNHQRKRTRVYVNLKSKPKWQLKPINLDACIYGDRSTSKKPILCSGKLPLGNRSVLKVFNRSINVNSSFYLLILITNYHVLR